MRIRTARQAFRQGWNYGRKHGEATDREAENLHEFLDMECLDAFGQGTIDGAAGDTWRLDAFKGGYGWRTGLVS